MTAQLFQKQQKYKIHLNFYSRYLGYITLNEGLPEKREHFSKTRKSKKGKSKKHRIEKTESRDVSKGATGATLVAPKFLDTLTLSPPRGADSANHLRRVATRLFPWLRSCLYQPEWADCATHITM